MGWYQRSSGTRNRGLRVRQLAMEALEPRLALTWAGIPPITVGAAALAQPVALNVNNVASGSASISSTEVDYYGFTATETGSYTISAITPTSTLDTVIGIFNSAGQRLVYNDNISATNRDSRLTMNLTAGTQYYLGVTNFVATSRGDYTWVIQGPSPPPPPPGDDIYENNDALSSAYNLGTLTNIRNVGQLKLNDSADWFRFSTTGSSASGSSVSISFLHSQGNLQLQLYNSSGSLLATSASTGNTESISLNGRVAGTYYVRISGTENATNPNYSLTIVPPTGSSTGSNFQITLAMTGMTATQQAVFNQAAARWSEVIIGDLPNANYLGLPVDDVLIHASAIPIDGVNGILGQAGPDTFRPGTLLPIHGIMQFDTADMTAMEANGTLLPVILHEMAHVLGVGTLWQSLGLLSGATTNNPIFTGPLATAEYNLMFNQNAAGVPVENTGGPGTRLGHWRESVFTIELMTGFLGPGTVAPMSRVTVAQFADLGYTVNMAKAEPFNPALSSVTFASQPPSSSRGISVLAAADNPTTAKRPAASSLWYGEKSNSVESSRRQSFKVDSYRITRNAIDAALTVSESAAKVDASDDFFLGSFDESDAEQTDLAWEDFDSLRMVAGKARG
jgi:hypothetical protein